MRWNRIAALALLAALTASFFLAPPTTLPARAQSAAPQLGYDPREARWLDLVQASTFALDEDALARLQRDGFAIGATSTTFADAYNRLFIADLPLFVSTDSVLYAMHQSYDELLAGIETSLLSGELQRLMLRMRSNLQSGSIDAYPAEVRADIDLYLAVALSLLTSGEVVPVAGADIERIRYFARAARAHTGMVEEELFGKPRFIDFSQFEPRGHYEDHYILDRYFRAMMWLGRIDVRMAESDEEGRLVLDRRQLEVTMALGELLDGEAATHYERIRQVIDVFVGRPDSMTPSEVDALKTALGIADGTELGALSDEQILATIAEHGFGEQRINAHGVPGGLGGETPLAPSFLLLGQAYVIDSDVFSHLVYDRFTSQPLRMMPQPLDVAAAVFGSEPARRLLADEYATYPGLDARTDAMRTYVDQQHESLWTSSLYNGWLAALRAFPRDPASDTHLPSVFRSEAWGLRLLNTQMASWAELRHDTLLYAKQSYTMMASCEFPDVYVDPYPEVWSAIAEFARIGRESIEDVGDAEMVTYFENLEAVATRLGEMAQRQIDGEPLRDADLEWANELVRIVEEAVGCTMEQVLNGWYGTLFYGAADPLEFDPTIADVHTQPTDDGGNMVGHVLHVGTGHPQTMVVTVDRADGPRAYVGLISSYYEVTTADFDRMTDSEWANDRLSSAARPWWQAPLYQ